jgi:hypothetical protein
VTWHKKSILLFVMVLFLGIIADRDVQAEQSNGTLVKRTIAVLPFHNLRLDENGYVATILYDALQASLQDTGQFNILERGVIKEKIKDGNREIGMLVDNELTASSFAASINADVVVFGTYAVHGDDLHVSITAWDVFHSKSVAVISIHGSTGLTMFETIHTSIAKTLAGKMKQELKMVDISLFEEFSQSNRYVIEEENSMVIQDLLKQPSRYRSYTVKSGSFVQELAIPRGYHVVLLVRDNPGVYDVSTDQVKRQSAQNGITMLVYPNSPGSVRHVEVLGEQDTLKVQVTQKKDSELSIRRIRFAGDSMKYTFKRQSTIFLRQAVAYSIADSVVLTSGLVVLGSLIYSLDRYYNLPVSRPDMWLSWYQAVQVLLPAMISLFSVSVALTVPVIVFWALYAAGTKKAVTRSPGKGRLQPLIQVYDSSISGGIRIFL